MKKVVPKKIDLTDDSKAKFFAETIARHFTEEVRSFPRIETETDTKLPTKINLTKQIQANYVRLSQIAYEVQKAKAEENNLKKIEAPKPKGESE